MKLQFEGSYQVTEEDAAPSALIGNEIGFCGTYIYTHGFLFSFIQFYFFAKGIFVIKKYLSSTTHDPVASLIVVLVLRL